MLVPPDTPFLPVCNQHNSRLKGTPFFTHPNLHATAVWVIDLSDCTCPYQTDNNNCQETWGVRA